MKYILYFSVLLFSSINVSLASSIHGSLDYQSGNYVETHKINITDAANFSVNMQTMGADLDEASVWLFDSMGDLSLDDQFWIEDVSSIDAGDLSAGDEGMYYLAISIFGIQPTLSDNLNDGWDDFTFPGNSDDNGEYWVQVTGVPAPPALWLLSVGMLVFFRARKKSV